MINKKNYNLNVSIPDKASMISSLLDSKIKGIKKGVVLTDDFISDIESFLIRNKIPHTQICCLRCLKAHALNVARQKKLDKEAVSYLHESLLEEEGHEGYYLDEDKLIKI